jgi:hypothetical protein
MSDTATLMDVPTENSTNQSDVIDDTSTEHNREVDKGVDPWSEDFDISAMDNKPAEEPKEPKQEQPTDESLDNLYRQQLEKTDMKLDNPILVKYKGKVIDISDANELRDLAERGIGATVKLQEAAELRKQFEGITPDDLELLRKYKGGDESVLNELATPRETVNETEAEIDAIATDILNSNYSTQFKGLVGTLAPKDRQLLQSDPRILGGLKIDFESGLAQKIMPMVERKMSVNGLDFLTAYTQAGKEVMDKGDTRKKSVEQLTAAPNSTTSVKTQPKEDIWSMDSATFQKLFNKQQR